MSTDGVESTLPNFATLASDHPDRKVLTRWEVLSHLADQEYAWADGRRGFVELCDWVTAWLEDGNLPTDPKAPRTSKLRAVETPEKI